MQFFCHDSAQDEAKRGAIANELFYFKRSESWGGADGAQKKEDTSGRQEAAS